MVPVVRAGKQDFLWELTADPVLPRTSSASHPPLAALAGPAQGLGAFSQPKHLYPCPSRGSAPLLGKQALQGKLQKGDRAQRARVRKQQPRLPPSTQGFRLRHTEPGSEEGGRVRCGRSCSLPTRLAWALRSRPDVMPTQ